MVIWRRDERGGAFDTHCLYFFEVAKAEDGWHISAITQKVLWNDGDPTVHAGVPDVTSAGGRVSA